MSDNRIQMPGQGPKDSDQPVKINMGSNNGIVEILFNPSITRMRMKPREARSLAIALLGHADSAENPPPVIEP